MALNGATTVRYSEICSWYHIFRKPITQLNSGWLVIADETIVFEMSEMAMQNFER